MLSWTYSTKIDLITRIMNSYSYSPVFLIEFCVAFPITSRTSTTAYRPIGWWWWIKMTWSSMEIGFNKCCRTIKVNFNFVGSHRTTKNEHFYILFIFAWIEISSITTLLPATSSSIFFWFIFQNRKRTAFFVLNNSIFLMSSIGHSFMFMISCGYHAYHVK